MLPVVPLTHHPSVFRQQCWVVCDLKKVISDVICSVLSETRNNCVQSLSVKKRVYRYWNKPRDTGLELFERFFFCRAGSADTRCTDTDRMIGQQIPQNKKAAHNNTHLQKHTLCYYPTKIPFNNCNTYDFCYCWRPSLWRYLLTCLSVTAASITQT